MFVEVRVKLDVGGVANHENYNSRRKAHIGVTRLSEVDTIATGKNLPDQTFENPPGTTDLENQPIPGSHARECGNPDRFCRGLWNPASAWRTTGGRDYSKADGNLQALPPDIKLRLNGND
jgi:hypothetical protein